MIANPHPPPSRHGPIRHGFEAIKPEAQQAALITVAKSAEMG